MSGPRFTRKQIGEVDNAASGMNTFFTLGDLNRDGKTDIVVSGRSGRMVWFENPGDRGEWRRHSIDDVENLECGGVVYDLTGSGYPDVIDGGDWRSNEVSWWENPGPRGGAWPRRVLAKTSANQFHDELIADVRNEGRDSLVFWNQGSGTLYWAPLPDDPRLSPWPGIEVIASGMREGKQPEEGLALADVDGDGRKELIAGTHWYRYAPGRGWERHKFASGYISTVIAAGDVDADGRDELFLSEGDACIYGKPEGGKLAWFKPVGDLEGLWEERLLETALLDPHSLQLGDLCGNGRLDLLCGEIGVHDRLAENPPKLMVFENDGSGGFVKHVIDEGTGTHHAKLADFRNRGVLDIASRPLHGPEKWKVFVWYNDRAADPSPE